ncbi:LPS translocon maturation chaperone LptM [Acinetobacter tianfuensis]|uniref:Lipoprotein n=1 Tax=Acinetobacter tianfuensis TaxID=2419603 RepID=A0A3A8EUQ9_9GAMM|nr:hypothetical protein [Acinetobacter tianfuensis]RKG32601.1 hypothetical protein D7V32_05255 [Acinetobacter tianfuensis]
MRQFICCMSLCALSSAFVGCGQSGALQLPSDPNYDKRSKYLLYSDADAQKKAENSREEASVQQPLTDEAAPSENTP